MNSCCADTAYGLYIHIPFCVKKCAYCDFASVSAPKEQHDAYFFALQQELENCKGKQLDSIFLGGGTPSCVDACYIAALFDRIYQTMTVLPGAEITLEANPGTLTPEKLRIYKECGVNRISLGVQSMQERELRTLGRIHSAREAMQAVELIHAAGFENVNLDLMLATPYQTRETLRDTLEKAITLAPTHISAYSLIVEPGTPFYTLQQDGRLPLPDEDLERALCDDAAAFLDAHSFIQYEISNYAKPGFQCRHNLKYWQCLPYLGLGAAAHGYDGEMRCENTADTEQYIRLIQTGKTPCINKIKLTEADKVSEYIIMALRLTRGIVFDEFARRFGFRFEEAYADTIRKYQNGGFFQIEQGGICFTQKGFAVSNAILSEFV